MSDKKKKVRPNVPLDRDTYKKVQKRAIDEDKKVSEFIVDLIEKEVSDESEDKE